MKGLEEEKEQFQWATTNSTIEMFKDQMPQGFEELLIFKIANYVIENKDEKPDSPREEEYNT